MCNIHLNVKHISSQFWISNWFTTNVGRAIARLDLVPSDRRSVYCKSVQTGIIRNWPCNLFANRNYSTLSVFDYLPLQMYSIRQACPHFPIDMSRFYMSYRLSFCDRYVTVQDDLQMFRLSTQANQMKSFLLPFIWHHLPNCSNRKLFGRQKAFCMLYAIIDHMGIETTKKTEKTAHKGKIVCWCFIANTTLDLQRLHWIVDFWDSCLFCRFFYHWVRIPQAYKREQMHSRRTNALFEREAPALSTNTSRKSRRHSYQILFGS